MSVGSTAFHTALNPVSTILSLEEKLIVSVSPAVTRSLGGDVLQWVPKKEQDTQYIISIFPKHCGGGPHESKLVYMDMQNRIRLPRVPTLSLRVTLSLRHSVVSSREKLLKCR